MFKSKDCFLHTETRRKETKIPFTYELRATSKVSFYIFMKQFGAELQSAATLLKIKALWLVKTRHMTCNIQSEFIYVRIELLKGISKIA